MTEHIAEKVKRLVREGKYDPSALSPAERSALLEWQVERERAKGETDPFKKHPLVAVTDETSDATADLWRPRSDYHHFPWPSLDWLIGGMPPGEVCTTAAFSSQGKTTLMTSYVDDVYEHTDKKLYYATLEIKPKTGRTHWACKRLGINAGDILSGRFLEWDNFARVRDALVAEIKSQHQPDGEKFSRVRFSPMRKLSRDNLYRAADHAADFGAHIFVVDHMDHGVNDYKTSVEVCEAMLDIAQEYGFLMMPTTQLNNDVVRNDPIRLHLPPQPNYVKFGAHKREMSTWMLGLYKPLRLAGVPEESTRAFNRGLLSDPATILEPATMAVVAMKHRLYGPREWKKAFLRVEHGKVFDRPQPFSGVAA